MGSQESMKFPAWNFIGFQRGDKQDTQDLFNDTFCRLPYTSAQGTIGTEIYLDAGILLNYDDDFHSQGYAQSKKPLEL